MKRYRRSAIDSQHVCKFQALIVSSLVHFPFTSRRCLGAPESIFSQQPHIHMAFSKRIVVSFGDCVC